jgi:hypothetical protein
MKSDFAVRVFHAAACLAPAAALLIWGALRTSLPEILLWTLALVWIPYVFVGAPKLAVRRELRQRAIRGFLAGMVATAAYTLFRWPASAIGLIPDVPMILGDHLWGATDVYWDRCWQSILLGYTMHFLLTGAAWGSAFAISGLQRFRFGSTLWACAVGSVFILSPLFPASLTYMTTAHPKGIIALTMFLAHVPYGWCLGKTLAFLDRAALALPLVETVVPATVTPMHAGSHAGCLNYETDARRQVS